MIVVPIPLKDLIHDKEAMTVSLPFSIRDGALLQKEDDAFALVGPVTGTVVAQKLEKTFYLEMIDVDLEIQAECVRCGKDVRIKQEKIAFPPREYYLSLPPKYKGEEIEDAFGISHSHFTADIAEALWQECTLLSSGRMLCNEGCEVTLPEEQKGESPFAGLADMMGE